MSNEPDGDQGDAEAKPDAGANKPRGAVQRELDVPPTRPSRAALGEPPERPSAMQLLSEPSEFPDDGQVCTKLRKIDMVAGKIEQIILFALFVGIVVTAVAQTIATKVFESSLLWSFDVIRANTFAIAMVGAAFASHQARHLSMDLVSRKIKPRARLVLRVVLGLFTIFAVYLLLNSGRHLAAQVATEGGNHTIPMDKVAMMIPVGGALIIFHTLLHLLIDLDYFRRGKLPPENAMTGH